jgi:hypothetical protein
MKVIFLGVFFLTALTTGAEAQKTNFYPAIVSFQSMCCGVPDDKPVTAMIKRFKKQHKIRRITADHIGPMGKEGEYYLAFRLKEMSKAQKYKFIQQLKKIVPEMKDRGSAVLEVNMVFDRSTLHTRATITTKVF